MLNDFQTKKFTHMFKLLDRSGDHFIDGADLELTVAALAKVRGLEADAPVLQALLERYRAFHAAMVQMADANKDGKVSLEEHLAYHQAMAEDEATYQGMIPGIAGLFGELLDHDGGGKNDVDDYRLFLRAMRLPEGNAAATFKSLDKNGDGVLSQTELQEILREFFFDATGAAVGNTFFGAI
jgi:hypothetical protein